ncbi:DUF4123 domain-containing protein [Iodobacter fluviatilis]|uniref:DUF4123 domain-containing protein n=1 Tax=Iodobacter fluviatilis TaxID=537 RepID=A0A7G3G6L8_9NEIS|nr:DUF4123 domain-containing protein [Iodobacter fluviatilis]QBC42832.1 hypothetical protein C1H71_04205 [Iodobacter fluviatilis]
MQLTTLPAFLSEQHESIKLDLQKNNIATPIYALIDLANTDNPRRWLRIMLADKGYCLFDGTPESTARTEAPWLVRVDQNEFLLNETITASLLGDCCSWICSGLPPAELAQRLNARLDVKLEGQLALLRFYDPRILPSLLAVLAAPVQRDFLALGEHWFWLGRDGLLFKQAIDEDEHDLLKWPLALSDKQQEPLIKMAETDQLQVQLGEQLPSLFYPMTRAARFQFVQMQRDQAIQNGFTQFNDQLDYCALALAWGPHFFHEEKWQAVLAEGRVHTLELAIKNAK